MSELRQDPTTGEWVAIAHERATREGAFHRPPESAGDPAGAARRCPFCPGAEGETPHELERLRLPGDDVPWRVRVVYNRFPAFAPGAAAAHPEARVEGLLLSRPGEGQHEVIVETPQHGEGFADFPPAHAALVLQAWQHRYRALAAREGMRAVVLFKNQGAQAGASLAHAHSQLVAVPVVPQRLALRQATAERYAAATGRALYADLLADERRAGTRVVLERPALTVLEPFAARWPYETWFVPHAADTPFEALPEEVLAAVAHACQDVLRALAAVEGALAFNLLLIAPPLGAPAEGRFPWHLQLVPRAIQPGGFELSTDLPINPLPPEMCAARLRRALREAGAEGVPAD